MILLCRIFSCPLCFLSVVVCQSYVYLFSLWIFQLEAALDHSALPACLPLEGILTHFILLKDEFENSISFENRFHLQVFHHESIQVPNFLSILILLNHRTMYKLKQNYLEKNIYSLIVHNFNVCSALWFRYQGTQITSSPFWKRCYGHSCIYIILSVGCYPLCFLSFVI